MSDQAKAFFEDATAKLQRRLDRCFEQLKTNPNLHPNIKSLKGKLAGCYRYQVGNYRVVYMIDEQTEQVFPGCVSQGKDETEAIENVKEAITAWLWAEDQKAVSELKIKNNMQSIMVAV